MGITILFGPNIALVDAQTAIAGERDKSACHGHVSSPILELLVHIREAVNDEADRRAQRLRDRHLAHQSVVSYCPVIDDIGQTLIIDHDSQIIVQLVAANRIVDPIAACIAAIKNDLEYAALLLLGRRRVADGGSKLLEQDAHGCLQLLVFLAR